MATTLTVLHPESKKFDFNSSKITHFVDLLLKEKDCSDFSLSLVLTDDAEIQKLNADYRMKNTPTNVLSFPFLDGADSVLKELPIKELGDIIISLDTAHREAQKYGEEFSYRLCWLTVHGFLHLCGMDHERSNEEARQMTAQEKTLLELYYQTGYNP